VPLLYFVNKLLFYFNSANISSSNIFVRPS